MNVVVKGGMRSEVVGKGEIEERSRGKRRKIKQKGRCGR